MISSSSGTNPAVERGLDTMLLVYSLLRGHPAEVACEHFLRIHTGWYSSASVFFEAKSILTKVYGEDPAVATQKLNQVAGGPLVILPIEPADVHAVLSLADSQALDFTDAALLHLAQKHGAPFLATDDQRLAKVSAQFGVTSISPFDAALRQAVANWEAQHVPPKGLPRVLRRVHQWLSQVHPQAALDFWSKTGAGAHLP